MKNIELSKQFRNQRENISWLFFLKHLKDFSLDGFEIGFEKGIATFRPAIIQNFNKFFKSWPDSSGIPISNFQIKDKDLRPVLCINKVKQEINVEDMRNRFIRNFQFEPENFKCLIKKNGRETTLFTFQLNSEEQIRQAKFLNSLQLIYQMLVHTIYSSSRRDCYEVQLIKETKR